mmetsp:Transcript_21710/g.28095  ORF Transcript_21710/g.28095 Transcript_21710/m.28095 type:complete len:278 (+) Transcript_21710:117-950(+)
MKVLLSLLLVSLEIESLVVSGGLKGIQKKHEIFKRRMIASQQEKEATKENLYALKEISKYVVATGIQYGILVGISSIWDQGFAGELPAWLIGLIYVSLSLRSRVFSPLDNSRPNVKEQDGKALPAQFKRPGWTPPGIAFPIIWSTIAILRGISSALIYKTTGGYLDATRPLLLHLCIGDTWNTITNVERRLGVSAIGVFAVWSSILYTVLQYYSVSKIAAFILAPSLLWISIASLLTTHIWLLNGGPSKRPAFPSSSDGTSAIFLRRFRSLFTSSSS